MTRIDWVILARVGSRIGAAIFVMFGIIVLAESLDTWRFDRLAEIGGIGLSITAIILNAAIWTLSTLPVIMLVGAIIGLLDLESRRERTVMSTTGFSVWRLMRAPLVAVMLAGIVLGIVGDAAIVTSMRALSLNVPRAIAQSKELWLKEQAEGLDYVLNAKHVHPNGTTIEKATFFLPEVLGGPRLEAATAELQAGAWFIPEATHFSRNAPARTVHDISIPTATTRADLSARLTSPAEMTIFDLVASDAFRIGDPRLRSGVEMRLAKLLAMPLSMAASLLIAFAFTAGYRRTNKYGATVLYGIVLGFVVYVVTEMAATAGSAGIINPAFAAFAPALVAMVVGTTVLLYREDGRR